ncbi:uncharacterized protein N7479_008499 [Penicillium vulpinum]|uniref:uncharacterized protein n=1 Tax=Penicillium vulpinum TaxID=29845 RepID=UPI00254827AE|nr:uncharacterized protein N7479_008499 [Penicillium vulpinum]KAJ5961349.1 hypothetical protein N7479_008499 [Penicillium vulpinum]
MHIVVSIGRQIVGANAVGNRSHQICKFARVKARGNRFHPLIVGHKVEPSRGMAVREATTPELAGGRELEGFPG